MATTTFYKVYADGVEFDIIYANSKAHAIEIAKAKHGDAVWNAKIYGT